MILHKNVNV